MSWPMAGYRAAAAAVGFQNLSGAAAVGGVAAASAAALLSFHPTAKGAGAAYASAVADAAKSVSAADAASIAAGAAAGIGTAAAADALAGLALAMLRRSPWALAAWLAMTLLEAWLGRPLFTAASSTLPAGWAMNCGSAGGSGRYANGIFCPPGAVTLSTADPAWSNTPVNSVSWLTWQPSGLIPPNASYVKNGSATRSSGALSPVYNYPGARRVPFVAPRPALQRKPAVDAFRGVPMSGGDTDREPLPYAMIPALGPNPYRAPSERSVRGYGAAPGGRRRAGPRTVPTTVLRSRLVIDGRQVAAVPIGAAIPEEWRERGIVAPPAIVVGPTRPGEKEKDRYPPITHRFSRAAAGTKEVKRKVMSADPRSSPAHLVHLVTEYEDFVEAIYKSLPKGIRDQCKATGDLTRMVGCIVEHWDYLEWDKALLHLLVESTTDMVFGAAGRAQAQANELFGWLRSPLFMSRLAHPQNLLGG